LVKTHPLPDGNKRTAHATMWMFIMIIGCTWTLEDPNEIVPMIIRFASGEISTEELAEWLSSNIKQ
jgi:death-on-curing family protein